jgi:nuclear cap-binding protein subunit 1
VTEEPYKAPYYTALLLLLHHPLDGSLEDESHPSDSTSMGRLILEDFWKGFQTFLDKQAWRELRLCVRVTH